MRTWARITALGTMAAAMVAATPALADDRRFFDDLRGRWTGPGEIVAGKYRGTRFSCVLDGIPTNAEPGMTLDGKCRVGLFSQRITATLARDGRSYKGAFLDGAAGKGLDVVSGNVSGDRVTVAMQRDQLKGAMVARRKADDNLTITVSVRIRDELVPVIGMDLSRVDGMATGSIR